MHPTRDDPRRGGPGPSQDRPLAVVTGASSGIGEAFAKLLAREHHDLLLIARRSERIEALASSLSQSCQVSAHPLALDLSEPGAPVTVVAWLGEFGRTPAVLVNNAGMELDGRFLDNPWESQAAMLQLMVSSSTELVHHLLPRMLENGDGRVITVASLGGFLHSTPFTTLYGPVKHFAIALNRSLAGEYRADGVTFTAVCPGFVRTEMMDHGRPAVAKERLPAWAIMSPEKVVKIAWKAAQEGTVVVVPGVLNKALVSVIRFLPTDFADRVASTLFDKLTEPAGP